MAKNKQRGLYRIVAFAGLSMLLCMACVSQDKDLYDAEYVKAVIEKSFDFKTTYDCPITVTFDRSAYFEVYENDPTVEGSAEEPFCTSFTDEEGRLNGVMDIPKYLKGKTVYVYTTNLCVRNLSEVTIGEGGINADLTFAAAPNVPVTRGDAVNKDSIAPVPGSVIKGIEKTLPEGKNNVAKVTYANTNVDVLEKCFIHLTFIHEFTGGHNKLWYFFYDTADYDKIAPNTKDQYLDFKAGGVVFEDVCYQDGLKSGVTVQLQYNGNDTIQPGKSVGWMIQQPRNQNNPFFYSINALNNKSEAPHTIILKDNAAQMVIFGFEDWRTGLGSWDLNDVLFSVKANPFKAIDNPDIPETEKPTEELKSSTESGTLLFEDLYPTQGDYDMNDVVVEYKLTKSFSKENLIRSVDLEITPRHDGALLTNGFAFMMDGLEFNEVTIDGVSTVADAGGAVIVYNKNKDVQDKTFKIHFTPKDWNLSKDKVSRSTFNPFIFVGDRADGVEVHLTKKKSSGMANSKGLSELVKLYITSKGMLKDDMMQWPFAMNIPTTEFHVVKETVRIDKAYPKFEDWVKGFNGNVNFDNKWWITPDVNQVY